MTQNHPLEPLPTGPVNGRSGATAAGPDRRRRAPAVGPPPADGERRLSGALLPLPTGTIEATLIRRWDATSTAG
jgi:hypothetical protein